MKPSLIRARIKGEAPTNLSPAHGTVAPAGPQLGERPKPPGGGGAEPVRRRSGSPSPPGSSLAKLIDWRGHAHPRD